MRGLGDRLADADADDVLALPAPRQTAARPALPRRSSAFFDAHARRFYRRTLDIALRFQLHHAAGVPRHGGADRRACTSSSRRASSRRRTPASSSASPRARRTSRSRRCRALQQQARPTIVAADPDVAGYRVHRRRRRRRPDRQQRPHVHRAEAVGRARRRRRRRFIAGSGRSCRRSQGVQPVPAAGAGHPRRRPAVARPQYQYTLQDADLDELNHWAPKVLDKLQALPMLRDVTTDQQIAGTTATLTIDRDQAARFGIQPQVIDDTLYDAFGQRQITQYFTQVNSYHLILEVTAGPGRAISATLNKLYVKSATGQAVPLSTFVKWSTRAGAAAVDQPPEPVPGGDDLLQPRAGRGARARRSTRSTRRCGRWACRSRCSGTFQGTAQAFQSSLRQPALPDRRGADHRLHHPRHPVRELHPAADHPVHAAVGRRRRAADADARATTTCR